MSRRVLIIDDEEDICVFVQRALKKFEIDSDFTLSPFDAIKRIEKESYDVILIDYKMPKMDGIEFLNTIKVKNGLESYLVILMTAHGDMEIGLSAINQGFFDYIIKPFNIENVIFRIKRALEYLELNEKIKILSKPLKSKFSNIIGESKGMLSIFNVISKVADKDTTILIEGDTGTGKEVIAKSIHETSNRKNNVFIPVNCGALTESLLESELFGHEKGAFTGAASKKFGILETANNGTVFLDEINNASLNVQSNLLRFIESGEFMRVGGTKLIHCDTRVVAASNKMVEDMVKEGNFREDLYHRLNIVKILIPPLRDRKDDIALLSKFFLDMFNNKFEKEIKMSKSAVNLFYDYSWPGNVRQLKNLIQSLVLLNESGIIKPDDLPEMIKKQSLVSDDVDVFKKVKDKLISEFEIQYFNKLLMKTKGNVSKASKVANLNRKHLIEKLKAYNINPVHFKSSSKS